MHTTSLKYTSHEWSFNSASTLELSVLEPSGFRKTPLAAHRRRRGIAPHQVADLLAGNSLDLRRRRARIDRCIHLARGPSSSGATGLLPSPLGISGSQRLKDGSRV